LANAIAARRHGDDFQARLFWYHAALLLDPKSSVVRVAYETGPKAFDDILIEYDPDHAPQDHEGRPVWRDYLQCKWHATAGTFGYSDFTDPGFIGASTFSFLQRAHDAQQKYAPDGYGCRFALITNHRIRHDDPLISLVRKNGDNIEIAKLFDGSTDRSEMGRIRKLWREHLSVDHVDLARVARVLSIREWPVSMMQLREMLDDRFARAGLKRVPVDEAGFAYDDLIAKLHSQGRKDFDRLTFHEMCRRERILVPREVGSDTLRLGIRSFMHPIDNLEDRCDEMLNLVPYFEGRHIRNEGDWQRRIVPDVRAFVAEKARSTDSLRLVLDAHVSLAFAVGTILNVKCGKRIEIEQRSDGRTIWAADDAAPETSWPELIFQEEIFDDRQDHMAVAISLTHDVGRAAYEYAQAQLPQVGRILHCRPSGGPSGLSVKCGRHARQLAEAVLRQVSQRPWPNTRKPVHFFIAGPNAFAFFLGQVQSAMGPAAVYEWDFEGQRNGTYTQGFATNG